MSFENTNSSGVQELIDRLHEEGVAKGQEQADAVVAAARQQAMETLDKAKAEAEQILASARAEAEQTRRSGEEAIRLAGRDTIHKLTEELRDDFERKLRGLIGHSLADTEFLKQLILEVARRSLPEDEGSRKVLLLSDRESAGGERDVVDDEVLNDFVRSLTGSAVADGLTIDVSESDVPGVRVQIVGSDLEIDLTTETLTHVLLKHLSPRFRGILESQ